MTRESWDSYFMRLAFLAATRATCKRRKVGAVLVQDKQVRGTGYNGAPAGVTSCIDDDCYLVGGSCIRTIHAEANVILSTDHADRQGATVYCTDQPCINCTNLLANSGVREVVYARPYHSADSEFSDQVLREAGIIVRHLAMDENVIAAVLGHAAERAVEPVAAEAA